MLFRALIDRLLGSNEYGNRSDIDWTVGASKISYAKYPSLPSLLTSLLGDELRPELDDSSIQHVFPALEMLRRAGPPTDDFETMKTLVSRHLSSRVWHIRDLAARTYCGFVQGEQAVQAVKDLLSTSASGQNALHGRLLAAKYIAERAVNGGDPHLGMREDLPCKSG